MKLVKCGKCGAQFDVATMRPGSTFPCGKCRSPVPVPAGESPATIALTPDQMRKALESAQAPPAPPAAKAQPKLPPAMQARAQAAPSTTRAAGAVPAPAAPAPAAVQTAPAPRAARRRAEPVDGAPEKKAPVALYAGIGVVVLGAIVAAVAMSGGSKTNDATKGPEPTKTPEPPPPPPKPKDPTIPAEFLTMTASEQHDALVQRIVSAGEKLAELEKLHVWLKDEKLANNIEVKTATARVIENALKADPNSEWARAARGDRRVKEALQACKDECAQAFRMQDPEERKIYERLSTADANPWADSAEWAKLEAMVTKVRAREERMKKEPRYLDAERKRSWVRENPMFKGVELTWVFADPYVIFQEVKQQDARDTERVYNKEQGEWQEKPREDGKFNPSKVKQNEEWAKKGELFTKRDAIIFNELNRRFRELFAERYKLPTLQEKGRLLTGLVMWNRSSFDKLLKEAGQEVGGGVRAFYSPPQQKIFHYIGDESLQNLDELKCAEGRVQKGSDQVTFHEGTHQLQHEYESIFRGKPLQDNETKVEPRKAMWFEEGIAEFMGAVEVEDGKTEYLDDVKWWHNRILLGRIEESRHPAFKENVAKWTIKEFLKPNDNGELLTVGQKLAPGSGPNMNSHFYCRAWAFCHFLWYYDKGKYREKFYQYLGDVMKGIQSSDKFAKMMGRPNTNDWGPIEKEYEWYWHELLLRKVGENKLTKQPYTPSTEAPEGKVEDDADFCETWDENHKGGDKKK